MGQRVVVPCSGGWDSAACAAIAARRGERALLVFYDYGQPYAAEEREAADHVAEHLCMTICFVVLGSIAGDTSGHFEDRNARLLSAAALEWPGSPIYFGTRNVLPVFDRHGDSNWLWSRRFAARERLELRTPLVGWPKVAVGLVLRAAGLDLRKLYSTDSVARRWRVAAGHRSSAKENRTDD